MNYHIGRLVLSSLCVGAFGAAAFRWCSFFSNTQRTENKTTDVVIHQQSRRLLKMDILMPETCWAHNNWNKITSDIKLVFNSSDMTCISEYSKFRGCKYPCYPNGCCKTLGEPRLAITVNCLLTFLTVISANGLSAPTDFACWKTVSGTCSGSGGTWKSQDGWCEQF